MGLLTHGALELRHQRVDARTFAGHRVAAQVDLAQKFRGHRADIRHGARGDHSALETIGQATLVHDHGEFLALHALGQQHLERGLGQIRTRDQRGMDERLERLLIRSRGRARGCRPVGGFGRGTRTRLELIDARLDAALQEGHHRLRLLGNRVLLLRHRRQSGTKLRRIILLVELQHGERLLGARTHLLRKRLQVGVAGRCRLGGRFGLRRRGFLVQEGRGGRREGEHRNENERRGE